ncbi:class E sortase [Pontimonas sp.]|nr:class E sortase [Pontimonas sp.]
MDQSVLTRAQLRRRRKFHAFLGVTGEVSLTLGVVLGLFWVWHLVVNDWIQGAQQSSYAQSVAEQWEEPVVEPSDDEDLEEKSVPVATSLEPPVNGDVSRGESFALLYVPRFGSNYVRAIAEGVDLPTVLNDPQLGIGRYPESSDLGELGNFAIAGHRTTFGAPFAKIDELRVGDRFYVEVDQGWHSYEFRNLEYVLPTAMDVLNEFPRIQGDDPSTRIITLTSCHPRFSDAERIIAYGVYEGWYPRENGPPADISQLVGTQS